MIATVANVILVLVGSALGLLFRRFIRESIISVLTHALGLCVAGVGISSLMGTQDMLCVIVCMVVGTVIGQGVDIEARLERGGEWLRQRVDRGNPNSRFTAPAKNCPCISPEFENPQGVPLDAIVFGGRRAKTAPLVYEARDWAHGVFVGSIMASETTAAASGAVGVVRRDPMAMLPFCGYNMGDYFKHWLEMGDKVTKKPKFFNVNWFRTDEEGHFLWPGFGDNLRVLDWILRRTEGKAEAVETPIGYVPRPEDIDLAGLDMTTEDVADLLTVDKELWKEDADNIAAFYSKFGDKLPKELADELETLKKNLQ